MTESRIIVVEYKDSFFNSRDCHAACKQPNVAARACILCHTFVEAEHEYL